MKIIGKILLGIVAALVVVIGGLYVISPDITEVHIETEIDASAEEVWNVLAHEFADIDKWASPVNESRRLEASDAPDGYVIAPSAPVPGRSTTSPLGELHEFITMYSEDNMELTFRAARLPSIITYMDDTQRVVPLDDNRSLLTFDVSMEASGIFRILGPLVSGRIASTFGLVQEDLKAYVETGQ